MPITVQDDQPLDDVEQARGSLSKANPQPEPGNPTSTTLGAGQRTKLRDPGHNSDLIRHLEVEKVIVLSFRSLQLQRITELQDELLGLTLKAATGKATPDQNENVDKALENYAKALRNYETLSLNALPEVPRGATLVGSILKTEEPEPSRTNLGKILIRLGKWKKLDPLLMPVLQWLLRYRALVDIVSPAYLNVRWIGVRQSLTEIANMESIPSEILEAIQKVVGNLGYRELDPLGREKRSQKTALTERISMAMFGGVALIAPMLIMTLHPSRNTSLITTSLATFIFALVLAVGATQSAGKDVLAATAAYAAVLVVFVGTNTTVSSQ